MEDSGDPTVKYKDGDIVWVKLGSSWWPGEVIDRNSVPEEILSNLRKQPLAIVKFFDEEKYEYVKNSALIYPYNCERKNDLIKKGMAAFRKSALMGKFPKDVSLAEVKTGGNPNILSDPMFLPEVKRNSDIYTPSPSKKMKLMSSSNPSTSKPIDATHITHRRFLGFDDYEAYICIQYPGKDRDHESEDEEPLSEPHVGRQEDYNCHSCPFRTRSLEIMIRHTKMHIQGKFEPVARKVKPKVKNSGRKLGRPRLPVTGEDDSLSDNAMSSDDNLSISFEVKKPKKVKSSVKKSKKQKLVEEIIESESDEEIKQRLDETKGNNIVDIRSNLLAEWDDSDEDINEENTSEDKKIPDETTNDQMKSCFDFDEDDDIEIMTTSIGRKIPRVIPDKKVTTSEENEEEDINRAAILKESESFDSKMNEKEIDPEFESLMESTAVPDLPDIKNSLKAEQNFHDAKTIKFPDKDKEVATKLTNPKKRFVKSFEDFELEMRRKEMELELATKEKDSDFKSSEETEEDTLDSKINEEIIMEKVEEQHPTVLTPTIESLERELALDSKEIISEPQKIVYESEITDVIASEPEKPITEPEKVTFEPEKATSEPEKATFEPEKITFEPEKEISEPEKDLEKMFQDSPKIEEQKLELSSEETIQKHPKFRLRKLRSETKYEEADSKLEMEKFEEKIEEISQLQEILEESPVPMVEKPVEIIVEKEESPVLEPVVKRRRGRPPKKEKLIVIEEPIVEKKNNISEEIGPLKKRLRSISSSKYEEKDNKREEHKIITPPKKKRRHRSYVEETTEENVAPVEDKSKIETSIEEIKDISLVVEENKEDTVEESSIVKTDDKKSEESKKESAISVHIEETTPSVKESIFPSEETVVSSEETINKPEESTIISETKIPIEENKIQTEENIITGEENKIQTEESIILPPIEDIPIPSEEPKHISSIQIEQTADISQESSENEDNMSLETSTEKDEDIIESSQISSGIEEKDKEQDDFNVFGHSPIIVEEIPLPAPLRVEEIPLPLDEPKRKAVEEELCTKKYVAPLGGPEEEERLVEDTKNENSNEENDEKSEIEEDREESRQSISAIEEEGSSVDSYNEFSSIANPTLELPEDVMWTRSKRKSRFSSSNEDVFFNVEKKEESSSKSEEIKDKVEEQIKTTVFEEIKETVPEDIEIKSDVPKFEETELKSSKSEDSKIEETEISVDVKEIDETKIEESKIEDSNIDESKIEETELKSTTELKSIEPEEMNIEEIETELKSNDSETIKLEDTPQLNEDNKVEGSKIEGTELKSSECEDKLEDSHIIQTSESEDTKLEDAQLTQSSESEETQLEDIEPIHNKLEESKIEDAAIKSSEPQIIQTEETEIKINEPDDTKPTENKEETREETPISNGPDDSKKEEEHPNEMEVKINEDEDFKFCIQTNLSNFSKAEEMSALTLAALSEIHEEPNKVISPQNMDIPIPISQSELVQIEGNLTVVTEKDLADGQVEITADKVISPKKSENVVEVPNMGTEIPEKAMTNVLDKNIIEKSPKKNTYGRLELLDILEGNSNSNSSNPELTFKDSYNAYEKKDIVQGICDFEECIPSQIVRATKSEVPKVAEIKKLESLRRVAKKPSASKLIDKMFETRTTQIVTPVKPKITIQGDLKTSETILKQTVSVGNVPAKTTVIKSQSKFIIKTTKPPVSTSNKPIILSEQIIKPAAKKSLNDIEDVEAFVIHKTPVPKVENVDISKSKITKSKAKILNQTIITPQGEIIQPTASTSQIQDDQNMFDINSMPIVLSDELLTPESIESMPIVLEEEKKVEVPVQKSVAAAIVKGQKRPRLLQSGTQKVQAKPAKYILVPSQSGSSSKSTIKRVGSTKNVSTEPSGNKIMIVTNQQGQQQRLLLTPAQQKFMQLQSKVTNTKVATVTDTTSVTKPTINTSISNTSSALNVKDKEQPGPSGVVLKSTTPQRTVPPRPTITKKSANQKVYGPKKTILIKNQYGETVTKIQGTNEADLDKQVAEKLEAIRESARLSAQNRALQEKKSVLPPKKSITKKTVDTQKPKTPPKVESVAPPLAPISSVKTTQENKSEVNRPLNQLVIQDAMGVQTTITEGQIVAFPSETVDGQPQSYMLVTLDEHGNLTPLNNEALMSLDPSLGLGVDLNNMVLQIDQGQGALAIVGGNSAESVKKETPVVKKEEKSSEGQQLILTGDPVATQRFLESLSDGSTDLANILASAEGGNILIHADGQQILINTNNAVESTSIQPTSVLPQTNKSQDILAAALADTDVFQHEIKAAPIENLYPNVLETSLTLQSPIMTPLEVPSTNTKKLNSDDVIGTKQMGAVDLPITITDPNISQTVAAAVGPVESDKPFNNSMPLLTEDIPDEAPRKKDNGYEDEGLCTLGGAMCSSLSEPPPDVFEDGGESDPSSAQGETSSVNSSEGSCEVPLQPRIVARLGDLQRFD